MGYGLEGVRGMRSVPACSAGEQSSRVARCGRSHSAFVLAFVDTVRYENKGRLEVIMQVHAPKGQYRVIGLDHIDTLDSPTGPLSKDFESFDEARDLADRMTEEYLWTYVYDDAGKLLHEASSYREQAQQVEMLSQEPPEGSKGDPQRTPR